jgi:hypothetical protein
MSRPTFANVLSTANPVINADPVRYTQDDLGAGGPPAQNATVDQLLSFLSFVTVNDAKLHVFQHNSQSPGPDAEVVDLRSPTSPPPPPTPPTPPAGIGAESPYDVQITAEGLVGPLEYGLCEIAGRFDLQQYTAQALASDIDQIQFQVAAKTRAIRAEFGRLAINGDTASSPIEFNGLNAMCNAGTRQGHTVAASSLTNYLDNFDAALEEIRVGDRNLGELLIVMNTRGYRKVLSLSRTVGGDDAVSFEHCEELGYETMHYSGIPVCISDHIATTGTAPDEVTNVFFMNRNTVVGVVNEETPDIQVKTVQITDAAADSFIVTWHITLASMTDLGLVRLEGFNVTIT